MSRLVRATIGISLTFIPLSPLLAASLSVPSQFPTIQSAINAAVSGDEVLLAPGTYTESFTIADKALTLRGATGNPEEVVIRPGTSGTILSIANSPSVLVAALSLRGGPGQFRSACGGSSFFGGAIFSSQSTLELENNILAENTGDLGGAIFLVGGQITVRNSTFLSNGTAPDGNSSAGAVLRTCDISSPAVVLIEDSQFISNGNPAQPGLDVLSPFNGSITLRRTRFENNSASVLRPFGDATVVVDDCQFINNRSTSAALSFVGLNEGANIEVRNSTFDGNEGDIVAILPGAASRLTATDNIFQSTEGGAIFLTLQPDDQAIIDRCKFSDGEGPAIGFNNDGGTLTLRNLLIANNQSDGIIANATGLPGSLLIANCTVANNLGTGIRTDATLFGSLHIVNCITTGNGVRQIGLPVIPGATLTVSNNIVQGGFPGIANRNVNPGFIDPTGATPNYQLAPDSAAIDAGDNNVLLTDATGTPTLDLARNDRRIDVPQVADSGLGTAPIVDIGAYEFRPAPTTPCPADRNTNGAADIGDIFDFLNAWFAAAASADFNTSGGVTLQDLFDFLTAYFAGCP